jgi:DNA-directed RNA polymerase subunit RPC12/RpoP
MYARSKTKVLSESFRTVNISFPVCLSCKKEFEKSLKFENAFESMKYVSLCSFIIAISMGYAVFNRIGGWWLLLLLGISTTLCIIGITLFIKTYLDPNRISNFIKLEKSGKVIIKDEELQQEVIDFLTAKKLEQILPETNGNNLITCPKCRSKQQKGTDFCHNCGKELRNM